LTEIYFLDQKTEKNMIPEDSFFSFFWRNLFTGTWFWRGLENSCFPPLLQDFFAGIPAGQEFLYFHQIPPDSSGFLQDSCSP
jgi:hypothetical protein